MVITKNKVRTKLKKSQQEYDKAMVRAKEIMALSPTEIAEIPEFAALTTSIISNNPQLRPADPVLPSKLERKKSIIDVDDD